VVEKRLFSSKYRDIILGDYISKSGKSSELGLSNSEQKRLFSSKYKRHHFGRLHIKKWEK
jgi:hypothetical protein